MTNERGRGKGQVLLMSDEAKRQLHGISLYTPRSVTIEHPGIRKYLNGDKLKIHTHLYVVMPQGLLAT